MHNVFIQKTLMLLDVHILRAILILNLLRLVLADLHCPTSCELAEKGQVLLCLRLKNTDLLAIEQCIREQEELVVIDLTDSELVCDCNLLQFTRQVLVSSDVVVIDDATCNSSVVALCVKRSVESGATVPKSGYYTLVGAIFNINDVRWRNELSQHVHTLQGTISTLSDPYVRHLQMLAISSIARKLEWEMVEAVKSRGGVTYMNSTLLQPYHTHPELQFEFGTISSHQRSITVVIFSGVIGTFVVVIVVVLMCKMECERPKIEATALSYTSVHCPPSDVGPPDRGQVLSCLNFLEELAEKKREKEFSSSQINVPNLSADPVADPHSRLSFYRQSQDFTLERGHPRERALTQVVQQQPQHKKRRKSKTLRSSPEDPSPTNSQRVFNEAIVTNQTIPGSSMTSIVHQQPQDYTPNPSFVQAISPKPPDNNFSSNVNRPRSLHNASTQGIVYDNSRRKQSS